MQKIAFAFSLILLSATWPPLLASQAGHIDAITPAAARRGESVTIKGNGLGARNVRITVGGVPAVVLSANGNQATFRVPDGVAPGMTQVTAINPGGQGSSIPFRMLEGILLPGAPDDLALTAVPDLPPLPVGGENIKDRLVLTRLETLLAPAATVGQVNAALILIDAGIVSSSQGVPELTIAVPRQTARADLERLAGLLGTQPGIRFAGTAMLAEPKFIFSDATPDSLAQLRHLLPSRFPAAWNVAGRLLTGADSNSPCTVRPIPVVVADVFGPNTPAVFSASIPSYRPPAAAPFGSIPAGDEVHGYAVALVLAAFGQGADPLPTCLDLRLLQLGGFVPYGEIDTISQNMPAGKFIVNYSMGFVDDCAASPCVPPSDRMQPPLSHAYQAKRWKTATRGRWRDFLMVVAAGNERDAESTAIYPGMGDARYGSEMSIAQQPDPLMSFVVDGSLWDPTPGFLSLGFTSLAADATALSDLDQELTDAGLNNGDAVEDNVIVVGSTTTQNAETVLTQHVGPEQLAESSFSNANSDVLAVGESVFNQDLLTGTSFAAPQVAGLAAYLWALDPNLEAMPPSVTKQAIVSNTRNRVIDAYATVLSLDVAATPNPTNAPMRLELLDVNHDGGFDEADIEVFLRHLYLVDSDTGEITHSPPAGSNADFSIYDLNGDGFTTSSSRRERFDLDRVGSTQYGAAKYSIVTQNIEGSDVRFDETALTDVEILCYYAYSPMFQGNPDARKNLLMGRCGLSVDPPNATVRSGQHQQFTANTPGNDSVTWSVTPATCGTIDQNGLFTADQAGTCTVTATDNNDPNESGTANVTVTAGTVGFVFSKEIFISGGENDFQGVLSEASVQMTADVLLRNNTLDCVSTGTATSCKTNDFAIPLETTLNPPQSQFTGKTTQDSLLTTGGTIEGQIGCGVTPQNGIADFGNWDASVEIVVPAGKQATLTLDASITVAGAFVFRQASDAFSFTGPHGDVYPRTFVNSVGVTPFGGTFALAPGEYDLSISGGCVGSFAQSQSHTFKLGISVN